jgi:hypothetical protein
MGNENKRINSKKEKIIMLNLIIFLLFSQNITKEQFALIEKDSISFSKLIDEVKKNTKQEECFT